MNKPKQGSLGLALIVSSFVVIAVASIGYYQFVYCPTNCVTPTSSSTTFTGRALRINITEGSSTKLDDAFAPNPVRLVIGQNNTVIFYNADGAGGAGVPHTATDRAGGFDTKVLAFGQSSAPITIDKPGTYNYFCQIHPTTMRGTIVVVAASATPGGATIASSSTSEAPKATK